jgi:hypothetical protein
MIARRTNRARPPIAILCFERRATLWTIICAPFRHDSRLPRSNDDRARRKMNVTSATPPKIAPAIIKIAPDESLGGRSAGGAWAMASVRVGAAVGVSGAAVGVSGAPVGVSGAAVGAIVESGAGRAVRGTAFVENGLAVTLRSSACAAFALSIALMVSGGTFVESGTAFAAGGESALNVKSLSNAPNGTTFACPPVGALSNVNVCASISGAAASNGGSDTSLGALIAATSPIVDAPADPSTAPDDAALPANMLGLSMGVALSAAAIAAAPPAISAASVAINVGLSRRVTVSVNGSDSDTLVAITATVSGALKRPDGAALNNTPAAIKMTAAAALISVTAGLAANVRIAGGRRACAAVNAKSRGARSGGKARSNARIRRRSSSAARRAGSTDSRRSRSARSDVDSASSR